MRVRCGRRTIIRKNDVYYWRREAAEPRLGAEKRRRSSANHERLKFTVSEENRRVVAEKFEVRGRRMTVCNLIYLLIIMYHVAPTTMYVPQNRRENYLYYFYKTQNRRRESSVFAS